MKLAFSADSQRLAVGIADGNLYSWRLRSDASSAGQQDEIFVATGADGSIHHVHELMDGKRILTAHSTIGGQEYLRLWSGPTDVDVTFIREPSKAHSAMIDSKARRIWRVTAEGLSSSSFDGADEVASGRASTLPIRKGGFTRDRSYAFAVDADGKVEAWSIGSASQSHTLPTGTPVIDAQPIGQCCLLALLHERGQSTVYDLAHPDRAAETLQLGEDVRLVRFGGRVDRVFVETSTAAEIRVSGQRTRLIKGKIGRPPRGAAFAGEDRSVFLLSDYDTRLLDSTEAGNDHVLSGHAAGINDGQVSPDGSRVATGSTDWTARIWDASSGAQLGVLRGHSNEVTQVEFRNDGRFIASAGRDGTIRVWNPIGGEQLLRIEAGTDASARILSFEGEYLLVRTGNKLGLYQCVACRPGVELLREARERMKAGIPRELALRRTGDTGASARGKP